MTADALGQREFEQLYREHHPRVLAICRQMLGSPDEAEDAANDVFARLPGSWRTYDRAQPFARWLARVAGNYCIDLLRKRRAERKLLEPADPEAPEPAATLASPLHELLSKEQTGAVRDALFALPERYLVPLVMRYYSDLSYDEIAQTLGTSRATVAVLIFRAKQRLRRSLSQPAGQEAHQEQTRRAVGASSLGFPMGALATLR
ncbi:MAG TPA: sigma-70 family RNA polymerase sigma factor [Terriglobia bacterium]|nr:sigma-70 family RNA polymerase sigma factor [Terriglobia bacterium]